MRTYVQEPVHLLAGAVANVFQRRWSQLCTSGDLVKALPEWWDRTLDYVEALQNPHPLHSTGWLLFERSFPDPHTNIEFHEARPSIWRRWGCPPLALLHLINNLSASISDIPFLSIPLLIAIYCAMSDRQLLHMERLPESCISFLLLNEIFLAIMGMGCFLSALLTKFRSIETTVPPLTAMFFGGAALGLSFVHAHTPPTILDKEERFIFEGVLISCFLLVFISSSVLMNLRRIPIAVVSQRELRHSHLEEFERNKKALHTAMTVFSEHQKTKDTGTNVAGNGKTPCQAVPAPPGITETVLDNASDEAFREIKFHLAATRFYQWMIFWALLVFFLSFFAIAMWRFAESTPTLSNCLQSFGSAGVGGALVLFAREALWNARVCQVSMAIYESLVAEVRASLSEIPNDCSIEDKRRKRGEIWTEFRMGLNDLWLRENKLTDKRSRKLPTK